MFFFLSCLKTGNYLHTTFTHIYILFFLTGAAAASRLYVDAVGKLGRQAQQGTWGGCADIGNFNHNICQIIIKIS